MNIWPLRFRDLGRGSLLFADDAGGFFKGTEDFLDRYALNALTDEDQAFLHEGGHTFQRELDLSYLGFAYRWCARQAPRRQLGYVILVPTLRCNLTCSYCQVSRAPEGARGFDWTEDTLDAVLAFIGGLAAPEIKIEFQGGEPLLRLDLLERVRDFCRQRFGKAEFVVCTNLQAVSAEAWDYLAAPDTFISTSLDGDAVTHQRQRTRSTELTNAFFGNLDRAIEQFGSSKVSALPTIDIERPPAVDEIISSFVDRGLRSIYLRPINHQGFARRGRDPDVGLDRWNAWHAAFIEHLIERNFRTGTILEEYYFSQCLKRVLRAGADEHVDLRNPNFFASDYLVIDHDGVLYPTDEARMQSRIGRIDLSVGHVHHGIDTEKVATLNAASCNNFDPDCIHCPYQPFCGSDLVDDISRYGRIDLPKQATWFCRRHTSLFDKVFELLYRRDEATRFSLSRWADLESWPEHLVREHQ
ncbi:His-Xaa-Ser system radical SAM maturase HxsB [Ancylobacter sonchi]|uniref:His-Xaa-Ser system radical SAM maturase HxsB n=1 Tax=Ancylobacter sonchi TaxID=1937790 RepID=UPI001BD28132|nr:His-Xaa-Ser system radical SAM maturase HxsB [Ancylobacter sonchi]MBS7533299.1 His-Xaa-Ser system radical SAM maturase HxsB [Ancylobacter sonchi]